MLDIKFIRDNPEKVKDAAEKRGAAVDVGRLLEIDRLRRAKIQEVESMRTQQNEFSGEIANLRGTKRTRAIEESRRVKAGLGIAEAELVVLEEQFFILMRKIPNIPDSDVPAGGDERDNKVLREVGERPRFDFQPRDYMELATRLGLVDTERAGKVSGSRFGYLKNEAVFLEFALVQFAFEMLVKKHQFILVIPPVLIKEEMMRGMGYIDSEKDRDERYFFEKDKLFLVGTSEQSIGPLHADEILNAGDLPKRYAGFSTCFRREAGSYGKDTYGILRVHQFDKMEMVIFSRPEESKREHELLLRIEEELMQALKIPYRVVALSTGDLSAPAAATFDIEAWLPGQNGGKGEYRETHSCSNTTDFQTRRLNIKMRTDGGKIVYAHLLNGTAFAIGRTLIAILENYQQEDGSVLIPEALREYMGGREVIPVKKNK